MKKSQLKQLIGFALREILAEKESESDKLLNMKIKNPETGNDIKLKSALGYPEDSQVYKAAKAAHDKAVDILSKDTDNRDSGAEEQPATEPDASSNTNLPAHKSIHKRVDSLEQIENATEEDVKNYKKEWEKITSEERDNLDLAVEAVLDGEFYEWDADTKTSTTKPATEEEVKDSINYISSLLTSDNLAKRDLGISAMGELSGYMHRDTEKAEKAGGNFKAILKKAGTTGRELYNSVKKYHDWNENLNDSAHEDEYQQSLSKPAKRLHDARWSVIDDTMRAMVDNELYKKEYLRDLSEKRIPNPNSKTMKKSQLKQLIASTLREIIAEKETDIEKLLNMKIKNPETGNDIELGSALGYEKDSPVYKAAKVAHDKGIKILKKADDKKFKNDPTANSFNYDKASADAVSWEKKKQAQKSAPTKEPAWNEMKKSKGNEVPSFWSNGGADVSENPSHKEMAAAQETWLTSDAADDQGEAIWSHFNDAMTSNDAARQEGAMSAMAKNMLKTDDGQFDDLEELVDDVEYAENVRTEFVKDLATGAKKTFKTIPGGSDDEPTETQPHSGYGDTAEEQSKSFENMAAKAAQRSKDALAGGDKELAKSFKNTAKNALSISKFLNADFEKVKRDYESQWDENKTIPKLKDLIVRESTYKKPKAYFVAPKNYKYKDEKDVEKRFKRIPRKLKNFFTPTSTGIEINKKKFHDDAEELNEEMYEDGTEYYLEDYVVVIDEKTGKNLMRVEEFREDDYPEFWVN